MIDTSKLTDALEARDLYLDGVGCQASICIVRKPKGQVLNGPCRCRKDELAMQKACYANNFFAEKVRDILAD